MSVRQAAVLMLRIECSTGIPTSAIREKIINVPSRESRLSRLIVSIQSFFPCFRTFQA